MTIMTNEANLSIIVFATTLTVSVIYWLVKIKCYLDIMLTMILIKILVNI